MSKIRHINSCIIKKSITSANNKVQTKIAPPPHKYSDIHDLLEADLSMGVFARAQLFELSLAGKGTSYAYRCILDILSIPKIKNNTSSETLSIYLAEPLGRIETRIDEM